MNPASQFRCMSGSVKRQFSALSAWVFPCLIILSCFFWLGWNGRLVLGGESEENPGVFSCNIEFRGRDRESIERVHACRRGVALAAQFQTLTAARSKCESEYPEDRTDQARIACLAGIRNYHRGEHIHSRATIDPM